MEKKKYMISVLLVLMLLTLSNFSFAGTYFLDVFGHWAEEDIMWGTNEVKLFKGYEDGTFKPDNYITRSEFISILYRTAIKSNVMDSTLSEESKINDDFQLDTLRTSSSDGYGKIEEDIKEEITEKVTEANTGLLYQDLDMNFWAYNDILAIKNYIDRKNEQINFEDIFPGNKFYPNKYITREEAALLTYFYTTPPIVCKNKQFSDLDNGYKYYDIIRNLVDNGIITGYEDNTFRPEKNITRGESATIIRRIYMNMKYFRDDYLNDIYLISNEYIDSTPLFGDYENIELTNDDFLYKKAISSLEYLDLVGRIPYEEMHLYDLNPLDTLNSLKENNYWNRLGIDYYIFKYGKLEREEKLDIYREILEQYLKRDDIKDYESLLIFNEGLALNDDLINMLPAVEKWKENCVDRESKYNAVFIMTKILVNSNRGEEALMLYTDDILEESIDIKFYYIINKAYVLINLDKFDEAKDELQEGWNTLKMDNNYFKYKEKYEDVLIGSIKKIMMTNPNMESCSDSQ